jgi:hypothetical protein
LETATLEFTYRQTLERLAAALANEPSLTVLEQFNEAISVLPHLPFSVDLWQVQNFYFQLLSRQYAVEREAQRSGDETARRWITRFQDLGRLLGVKVPD